MCCTGKWLKERGKSLKITPNKRINTGKTEKSFQKIPETILLHYAVFVRHTGENFLYYEFIIQTKPDLSHVIKCFHLQWKKFLKHD